MAHLAIHIHDAMQRQHARAHRLPGHLAAQLGAAAQQECGRADVVVHIHLPSHTADSVSAAYTHIMTPMHCHTVLSREAEQSWHPCPQHNQLLFLLIASKEQCM